MSIKIKPTTRTSFWNRELEELWRPRFSRMSKLYHDTEIATFLTGMRRVYVYHVNSQRFIESYEFLRKNDLVFFPTNETGTYQGFAHGHPPKEKGKPYQVYGAIVRRDDQEAGELFVEYSTSTEEKPTNHKGIGEELLGYPDCGADFFAEHWNQPSVDPMYEAALNTKDVELEVTDVIHGPVIHKATVNTHPYCNNMLRCFGFRITPHLTCSMQCEKTIKWGEEWFEIMRQIDEEAADWLLEVLSMPLTWDYNKGAAIVDTPIFRGITNSNTHLTHQVVVNRGWEVNE